MTDFESYQSPFSWRYGSAEMRHIWSEAHKRRLWRHIWTALAETEAEFGLVSAEQVEDLRQHAAEVNIQRALEIEAEIHHDLMAELKTFAEQAPTGGAILHLGATSMDIEDNADALRLRESLRLVLEQLSGLLEEFAARIEETADLPVMGFTHLQPAEPTTMGYRLAVSAQDLLADWEELRRAFQTSRGKGFKGAVGTGAAYIELVGAEQFRHFEERLAEQLGLEFYPAANQTYPRKQDYRVLNALAGLGASLYKFAFDLRLLQSPVTGEASEPFGSRQVGSSAMPFKRNPIHSEKIDSLARMLAQMPVTAWNNAAHSLLERTLDDSANRRSLLPEAFLICDELLRTTRRILRGLVIQPGAIERNLQAYAPFAAVERVLMAAVKGGADRQAAHEHLRELSLAAWEAVQAGQPNPLPRSLMEDPELNRYISATEMAKLMQVRDYLGIAPERARETAASVRATLAAGQ